MAGKQNERNIRDGDGQRPGGGLDVATVAPWILFWGWVALDSALAYRKSQTALEEAAEAETPSAPYADEPHIRRWLGSSTVGVDDLNTVRKRSLAAMIGAPVMAVLGPVLLGAWMKRRKSRSDD